jgi:hypothetical protein
MRVFSVEMLVKEEGAAVVEAALKRLKGEANAVAAQMKVTTSQVTSTGTAMKAAGQATEIAKDRAAKAAIGFAAVGQSMARTGSITADAGTRIVQAGSQIAMMFGPAGLVVAGLLATAAAIGTAMFSARSEIEKTKKELDKLVDVGDIAGLQRELDKLVLGTASQRGRDAITAQAIELAKLTAQYGYMATKLSSELTPEETRARARILELSQAVASKRDQIVNLQEQIRLAGDAQRYHTQTVTADTTAVQANTAALKAQQAAAEAQRTTPAGRAAARAAEAGARREMARGTIAGMPKPALPSPLGADFPASVERDLQETANSIEQMGLDILLPIGAVLSAQLGESIGNAVNGGIVSGLQAAIATGNIGDAFQAIGQAIISSLASAMVEVALAAIEFGTLMAEIQTFMANHPALAVASAIALLALARSMGGSSRTAPMVATGGTGGLTYSAAGRMSAPTSQIIFGATSATTAAGMQPRQAINVTIIGPNDPSAQRAMQELMAKANSRGRVG